MKKIVLASLMAATFSAAVMAADLDITVLNLTHGNTFMK
jgi:opacity protein-like surface antigen